MSTMVHVESIITQKTTRLIYFSIMTDHDRKIHADLQRRSRTRAAQSCPGPAWLSTRCGSSCERHVHIHSEFSYATSRPRTWFSNLCMIGGRPDFVIAFQNWVSLSSELQSVGACSLAHVRFDLPGSRKYAWRMSWCSYGRF